MLWIPGKEPVVKGRVEKRRYIFQRYSNSKNQFLKERVVL